MNENWYDKTPEQLERRFSVNRAAGLTRKGVQRARREYGPNSIYTAPKTTLADFRSYVPIDAAAVILLAVAVIARILELPIPVGSIVALIVVNFAAAAFTFLKAQKVLCGMHEYSLPACKVLRDGQLMLLEMNALVPGDVIFLSAGDIVPADCRLFQSENLTVHEGSLTGVQRSVPKSAGFSSFAPNLPLAARANMAYATTVVTGGNARAIVVATGAQTEAVIAGRVKPIVTHENLAIFAKLRRFCSVWSQTMLLLIFAVTVIELFAAPADGIFNIFLSGLSLSVSAMSELWAAFGYVIIGCGIFGAMGRKKGVGTGALIKNAEKLEDLKTLDTLIVPKDGMISCCKAEAERIYIPRRLFSADDTDRRNAFAELIQRAVISTGIYGAGLSSLNSRARRITVEEEAIIGLASRHKLYHAGLEKSYPIVEHCGVTELSLFDTTLTLDADKKFLVVCRGEAQEILDHCESFVEHGRLYTMSTADRLEFLGAAQSLIRGSYRVTAVASRESPYNSLTRLGVLQNGLTFHGFIAMREPLQRGVAQTIERCRAAGVRVIMTTDRYTESDRYLASSIGVIESEKNILTAKRLEAMPRDLLRANLPLYSMYCGISTRDLSVIVSMLREDGAKVGLMAGGIGGALLLKRADVGFAQSVTISPKAKTSDAVDIRSRTTPAYSRITPPTGHTYDCEALKFISDVVVSDADEHGRGGLGAVVSTLAFARTIYKNVRRMVYYLTTSQLTRIFTAFGVLLTARTIGFSDGAAIGTSILTPIQLLVSGLALDFIAVIAAAFSKPPHDALTLRDDAEEILTAPLVKHVRTVVFALCQTSATLLVPLVCRLIGKPISAAEFGSVVFLTLTICQLVTLLELESEKSLFRTNLRLNLVWLTYIAGLAGLIALSLLVPPIGAFCGVVKLPPAPAIATAVVPALMVLLYELYKLAARHPIMRRHGSHFASDEAEPKPFESFLAFFRRKKDGETDEPAPESAPENGSASIDESFFADASESGETSEPDDAASDEPTDPDEPSGAFPPSLDPEKVPSAVSTPSRTYNDLTMANGLAPNRGSLFKGMKRSDRSEIVSDESRERFNRLTDIDADAASEAEADAADLPDDFPTRGGATENPAPVSAKKVEKTAQNGGNPMKFSGMKGGD